MHLVTGRAGSAHINSDMVGRFNAGIIGHDAYILDTQNGLAATVESANAVTIATGDAIVQGRHVTNESPETLTIQSGGQGVSRYDLIVIRYTNSGGIESATLAVITGTPSSSPADPSYNNGSILDGETTVDIPLYRVVIDGLNIDHVDTLAKTINQNANIGEYLHEDLTETTVSVRNDTVTTVGSKSFPAGTWVITGGFYISSNNNGMRAVYMGTDSSRITERESTQRIPSPGSTYLSVTRVVKFEEATTVYFNVWQNSGSALSGSAMYSAVRIA